MDSKIVIAAPFCPAFTPRQWHLYEIRTYTMAWCHRAGRRVGRADRGAGEASPLAAAGHTELGPLNQWIRIWAWSDVAERFRSDEARAAGAWPPATRACSSSRKTSSCPRRSPLR
jgi:hypothetical protein